MLCIVGCSRRPQGLSNEKMKEMISDLIKRQPKRVLNKAFSWEMNGLDEVAILSVDITSISMAGKGNDRGTIVWTANFRAKGTLLASGKNGGMYEFEFDDRMQFVKKGEEWTTRFRD